MYHSLKHFLSRRYRTCITNPLRDCIFDGDATKLVYDQKIPAPVLPRFYSIDRTDDNYNIEFGWDTIGYMYVFGDFLSVPQMQVSMPCEIELNPNKTRIINYRSGKVMKIISSRDLSSII